MYAVTKFKVVDDCRFCAIAEGRHSLRAHDIPIMAENGYFGIASIGGFVPGWSLVCPRDHRNNLALEYRNPGFHVAVSSVANAITAEFGGAAIFEHGSVRDDSLTSCGTCHAHLHIVPFAGALVDLALSSGSGLNWSPVGVRDVAAASAGSEYLFVANRYEGTNTVGYLAHLPVPRSQFFRRLLASELKVPHLADYRTAPLEDVSGATAERVRGAFVRLLQRAA